MPNSSFLFALPRQGSSDNIELRSSLTLSRSNSVSSSPVRPKMGAFLHSGGVGSISSIRGGSRCFWLDSGSSAGLWLAGGLIILATLSSIRSSFLQASSWPRLEAAELLLLLRVPARDWDLKMRRYLQWLIFNSAYWWCEAGYYWHLIII